MSRVQIWALSIILAAGIGSLWVAFDFYNNSFRRLDAQSIVHDLLDRGLHAYQLRSGLA